MRNFKKYLWIILLCLPSLTFATNTYYANFIGASTQYLTAADAASIRLDDGWTLGFWYICASNPISQMKVITQRSGENGFGVSITTDGYIRLFAGSGAFSNADSNVAHCNNAWHHVRIDWEGANTKLYVDNALENTLNVPAITPPNTQLVLGADETGTSANFTGTIDDIRLYPSVWDGTNYNCDLTSETGLNAHWRLDNTLGDDANGNSLTNHNTVTFLNTSLPFTSNCGSGGGGGTVTSSGTSTTQQNYEELLSTSEILLLFLFSAYLVYKLTTK